MDGPYRLYSTSEELLAEARRAAAGIAAQLGEGLRLVEVITLPDLGQRVILRFDLGEERLSFAEADALETRMRGVAGGAFWTALIGDAYDGGLPDTTERLIEIGRAAPVLEALGETAHSRRLRQDGDCVRAALGLGEGFVVFEIEVGMLDAVPPVIVRIVETGEPGTGLASWGVVEGIDIGGKRCTVATFRNNPSFVGCVQAYLEAERRGVALASVIAEESPKGAG